MFQNINEGTIDNNVDYVENKKENKKIQLLENVLSIKNIPIYIISFMISMVGIMGEVSPFSISVLGACIANSVPLLAVVLFSLMGSFISFGTDGLLTYILTALVLIITMFIFRPIYNDEEKNEKIKLSKNIFISYMIIQLAQVGISGFTLYDILSATAISIVAVVFYKIFVNSIIAIRDFNEGNAFSIEEVLGASLMLAIAFGAFGEASIFGFSVRNILSILIVLILGWKNGVLVGTTAGVTIGVTIRNNYII